jgi:hypothetical protein
MMVPRAAFLPLGSLLDVNNMQFGDAIEEHVR